VTLYVQRVTLYDMRSTPHTARFPDDVWEAAKTRAAREHRTMTDVLVRLLREWGTGETDVPVSLPARLVAAGDGAPEVPAAPALAVAGGGGGRGAVSKPARGGRDGCLHPGVGRKQRCPACGMYNV